MCPSLKIEALTVAVELNITASVNRLSEVVSIITSVNAGHYQRRLFL